MDIEHIARVAHAAVRGHQAALGETPPPLWDDAPPWQRESTLHWVAVAQSGASAADLHARWVTSRLCDGWRVGEAVDEETRTHPNLVPYEELTARQRASSVLFVAVVRALTWPEGA